MHHAMPSVASSRPRLPQLTSCPPPHTHTSLPPSTITEKRAKEASKKSQGNVTEKVCDDLEAERSPESILLSAVTLDSASDRADRELLTPWLRFLWESFRTVLDILRNNNRLESVYHGTCARAIKFCVRYQRKTEFRRLAEMVRNHLASLQKFQNLPQEKRRSYAIVLNADVYERHVATRFEMLTAAAQLGMWTEGGFYFLPFVFVFVGVGV